MRNLEEYERSGWIERIKKYESVKDEVEYWKLECERKDDNIIRQVNEINTKLDALLFSVNCLMHSQTNKKGANSKIKPKVDKLPTKGIKAEHEANKRGRPRKVDKGE